MDAKKINMNLNRYLCVAIVTFVLSLLFLSYAYANTIVIPLRSGKIYRLPTASYKTVYIADNTVVSLQIQSPGVLYLTGQRVGSTVLYVVDAAGGVVLRENLQVVLNVDPLIAQIRSIAPQSHISVTSLNNTIILRGEVPSPGVGAKIREAAQHFASVDRVIDNMVVRAPAQVYLRVKLVELSRGVSRMIGLKSWSVLYHTSNFNIFAGNDTGGDNFFNTLNGTATNVANGFNVASFFEALDEDSLVRILSEPNLTALSGQEATFFAGGEFPVLVPQTVGSGITAINTVQYFPFGVSLNFIPTLLEQDIINLQVKTEVSQISTEGEVRISGNSVPSLTSRKASTTVQLRSGQSFAIAGLMQDNLRDVITRFPLLGRLPILGPLFNSREFQEDQSELVIIVTPYLVRPVSGELATPIDGVSEQNQLNVECVFNAPATACAHQPSQMRYITE